MIIESQISKFQETVQREIAILKNELHKSTSQENSVTITQDQFMKLNMVHEMVDSFQSNHQSMKQDVDIQQKVFDSLYQNNLRQNSSVNNQVTDMHIKKLEDVINNLSQSINLLKSQNSINSTPKTASTLATYSASPLGNSNVFQGDYPVNYMVPPGYTQNSQIFGQPKGNQNQIFIKNYLISRNLEDL